MHILGVPRKTADEKEFADFSIFEDPDDHYSTFNFHYPPKPFDRLSKLCEFNTLLGEEAIKDVMADCVRRRRGGKVVNGTNEVNDTNGVDDTNDGRNGTNDGNNGTNDGRNDTNDGKNGTDSLPAAGKDTADAKLPSKRRCQIS